MTPINLMVIYLIIINLTAFALMGIDKQKARKGKWRISEKSLFLFAILGGSPGGIMGMYYFHHKTKHWYFRYGFPLILIIQIALIFILYQYCN